MKALWLLPLLAGLLATGEGMVYGRCELAQQLQQLGLPGVAGSSLADWMCIAFHESSYNTEAIHYDSDGSADYGIFQINSRYWCQGAIQSSNICGISCSALLTNNLAADVACAKTVVENSYNGLGAWVTWGLYCQGQDLSQYVEGCGV